LYFGYLQGESLICCWRWNDKSCVARKLSICLCHL